MKLGKINVQDIVKNDFISILKHIYKPPNCLYVAGKLPGSRLRAVAIIGSRRPSAYGIEMTQRLAYSLAKRGIVIISGLAYGIDTVAHKAALEAGGTTIAVMAGGLHKIYPAANLQLAQQIIKQGGAIISEYKTGLNPTKYSFLERNRLVSGLADAVLVTEATKQSGTLSTIAHSLEQNKEIFAVPGPIDSLLSVGPNDLIKQGANLVSDEQDILRVIAPELISDNSVKLALENSAEQVIINLLNSGTKDPDKLQLDSGLLPGEFFQTITMLELKGVIKNNGLGGWYVCEV